MVNGSQTVSVSLCLFTAYEAREQSCSVSDATIPGCRLSSFSKPCDFQALYMALKSAAFLHIYIYF